MPDYQSAAGFETAALWMLSLDVARHRRRKYVTYAPNNIKFLLIIDFNNTTLPNFLLY